MKKSCSLLPGILSGILIISSILLLSDGCKKGPDWGHGHPTPKVATGSLQNFSGDCLPGTVHGTWYNGVLTNPDTNYVEVSVDVSGTGYYRIATDQQDGVIFADSGAFTSTGLQTVRLKAIGKFDSSMAIRYTVGFNGTICGFSVAVQDSGRGNSLADNSWRFTAGGRVYNGPATLNVYTIPQSPGSIFSLSGRMASNSPDTTLGIEFFMPNYWVEIGTYPTSTFGNYFALSTSTHAIFQAHSETAPQIVNIHITNATLVTGPGVYATVVVGTFNGTAVNTAGTPVPITNGAFKVILQ